jgi:hypothetical protein
MTLPTTNRGQRTMSCWQQLMHGCLGAGLARAQQRDAVLLWHVGDAGELRYKALLRVPPRPSLNNYSSLPPLYHPNNNTHNMSDIGRQGLGDKVSDE